MVEPVCDEEVKVYSLLKGHRTISLYIWLITHVLGVIILGGENAMGMYHCNNTKCLRFSFIFITSICNKNQERSA